MPRVFAGAISDKKSGDTTVNAPAPSPLNTLENKRKPKIPEENICMSNPAAHTRIEHLKDHSLPSLSLQKKAIKAPKAAPRTPNDVMLAVLLARPVGSCFQFALMRL
jgi:hypothetical protein